MKTTTETNSTPMITRKELLVLLDAGLRSGAYRWVRQTAVSWLAQFSGDLTVMYLQALSIGLEGRPTQAKAILDRIIETDPEYIEAYQVYEQFDGEVNATIKEALACLTGDLAEDVPAWCKEIWMASQAIEEGNNEEAEAQFLSAIGEAEHSVLAAIIHVKIAREMQDPMSVARLAELYHQRWDKCLQFKLFMADALMQMGNESEAVKLLHECAAADNVAQVPIRMWGAGFAYLPIWPDTLEASLEISIPAEVASVLGMNRLAGVPTGSEQASDSIGEAAGTQKPTGDKQRSRPRPQPHLERPADRKNESVKSIEREFQKIADGIKKPSVLRQDGRFPVYVVLTTRGGLTSQYGAQTALVVEQEITNLVEEVRRRAGWSALAYIPDDEATMTSIGLKVAAFTDPWQIKLALVDLDQALAKKGQMIGAVVVVGGPEVVPFHMLPNPTDDDDEEIPSDNPYATLDSNYFVPEWPVGRLPGEAGPDAGLLISQIRNITDNHRKINRTGSKTLPVSISDLWNAVRRMVNSIPTGTSFGYTAEVWRRSSLAAFRPIGQGRSLRLSPPLTSESVDGKIVVGSTSGYFNLHGVSDGPEWFGQRDPLEGGEGPDYPVALRPEDLKKNGRAPKVVFSEACYGGLVTGKSEANSIALKFLSIGTLAVVGSTVVAYGSVTTPLIGADLLGFLFWRYLREGFTTGEALVQAKVDFVREMNRRQGFLDGEDQKTLISFILYGDPLTQYSDRSSSSKGIGRMKTHMSVRTVCDKQDEQAEPKSVSVHVIEDVKTIVSAYLPGLEQADVVVSLQHAQCDGKDHRCPTADLGKEVRQAKRPDQFVVTISKDVHSAHRVHHHYARVTVNGEGKVTKLVVSR